MRRLSLIALLLAGCLEQPGFQCPADPWLKPFIANVATYKPYTINACPSGMPIIYSGSGCVPCVYYDQCGAGYDVANCSPGDGVFCWNGEVACPAGFEIPANPMVARGDV